MSEPAPNRLLVFARKLLPAATFGDLLAAAREEVHASVGYQHVWLMVADNEQATELRLLDYAGDRREVVWDVAPVLKVEGDKYLEELVAADGPVVIEDARVDPRTNKQIVEQLQNRTLINIPLRLLDKPFGIFGLGTFGDEGCRAPTPTELDYLVGMASQIAVAAGRIRFIEARLRAQREKQEFDRRLLQIQKLESMGMLAGGIAHDFNNLLTVILSSATLAQEHTQEQRVLEELGSVIEAGSRARDLTRQLLAMSRQQELRLQPLDIHACLGQLLDLLRRLLPATIEVRLVKGVDLPTVEADRSQVDQVFMNLAINARDAMPSGGRLTFETEEVELSVDYAEAHPWAKAGHFVLVTVTDTGVGMSREVLDRIFEPFFTTKAPHAGTGLGLAVAYGVVYQHGGMLHCYSEVGVGTSFRVYLPTLARMAGVVAAKPSGNAPKAKEGERVLIAEDDARVRAVAVRILRQAGYDVTPVASGDSACELAGREPFSLVILDVIMPGMACGETIARLQVLRPGVRILLASGYSTGANVTELTRETGIEILRKPYDPDGLLRGVRRTLDR